MNSLPAGEGELAVAASTWALVDVAVSVSLGRHCIAEVRATTTEPHGARGQTHVGFWTQFPRPDGLLRGEATPLVGRKLELRELEGAEADFVVELPDGETKDGVLYADGGQHLVFEEVDGATAVVAIRASFSLEQYEERTSHRVDVVFRGRGELTWHDD